MTAPLSKNSEAERLGYLYFGVNGDIHDTYDEANKHCDSVDEKESVYFRGFHKDRGWEMFYLRVTGPFTEQPDGSYAQAKKDKSND
jgi:hypothetical protein